MPAAFNEIGVKCVTAALVESVDVQKQLEHKILKKSDGAFETGNRYEPSFSFTVKGRGIADESLLGGASGAYIPEQIAGGTTIITSVKVTENNDDFPGFEIQAVAYDDI